MAISFPDTHIHPLAKGQYFVNQGFQDWQDCYTKNYLAILYSQVEDMTYDDMQKFVYMADNQFSINDKDEFITEIVKVPMKEFLNSSITILREKVQDAVDKFREINEGLIN